MSNQSRSPNAPSKHSHHITPTVQAVKQNTPKPIYWFEVERSKSNLPGVSKNTHHCVENATHLGLFI
jgi:hypothetical protein